ncbi:MAG: Hpt domain-containing protein [Pseudomonadota bacterium]
MALPPACTAFPEIIYFIARPGFRRKLDEARLRAAGIEVTVADGLDEIADAISEHALALIAEESLLDAVTSAVDPCWIEFLGDGAVTAAELGIQALPREGAADVLARIVAPHASADHALEPAHWQELDLLRARAPDRVEGILRGYLNGVEERQSRLRAAVADHALDEVGRLAHAWKGAAGSVGADRLAAALSRLDHAARRGETEATQRLLAAIEGRADGASRAIAAVLAGTPRQEQPT